MAGLKMRGRREEGTEGMQGDQVNYAGWGLSRLGAEVWWRRERRGWALSAPDDKYDGRGLSSRLRRSPDGQYGINRTESKKGGPRSDGVAWRIREMETGWKGEGCRGARNDPLTINRWVFRLIFLYADFMFDPTTSSILRHLNGLRSARLFGFSSQRVKTSTERALREARACKRRLDNSMVGCKHGWVAIFAGTCDPLPQTLRRTG
jgi:hypothetical protein